MARRGTARFPLVFRGAFFDLKKYLETQFEASAADARRWTDPLPRGMLLVAGDKVLVVSAGRLTALARSDGKHLGQVDLPTQDAPLSDGLAVAEGKMFLVTAAGGVLCLSAR